jgi:hypothetical protein
MFCISHFIFPVILPAVGFSKNCFRLDFIGMLGVLSGKAMGKILGKIKSKLVV